VAVALAAGSCSRGFVHAGRKLVVIGIDGMDPDLLTQYMAKGAMPNFARLAEEGTFLRLGTSNPPQSPVAWSCFITGMDPGGHGVFDFLHRDPKTYAPVSSTQTSEGDGFTFPLPGCRQIHVPPSSEPVRKGTPFWELLAERGVRADVYRIPSAYPIQPSRQLTLSDMGTPDLQGGIDGMYFYYTSDIPENVDQIGADNWRLVKLSNGRTTDAKLLGPPSPFHRACRDEKGRLRPVPMTERPFTVYVDPEHDAVHVEIEDGDSCVLEVGQWSEWLRCSFVLGPYACHPFDWLMLDNPMTGMVKFHLQQAHPELRLYCSPVNIDPRDPCMQISTPGDEAVEELCEAIGPFYTQGLAEETKALQEGAIDDAEFVSQCDDVNAERMRMLDFALDRFDDGLLFFYFSAIDLRCHMMWRHIEPGHPARDEALAARFAGSIEDAYVQMDRALGRVRERIGAPTPILVLSDHGFAPFVRNVNLNQWLHEQGYLTPSASALERYAKALADVEAEIEKGKREHPDENPRVPAARVALSLSNADDFDLGKTRAYAVGFNSIYLNLKGREAGGCVDSSERDRLLEEIRTRLLDLSDPQRGGAKVIVRVDRAGEIYHGDQTKNAPDLIVGYDRGYGASDETALGQLVLSGRAKVLADNKSRWSGNHLMAPEVVPGVLLANRKLDAKEPTLLDVTATMLACFGVPAPPQMRGRSLF
jgi:predicted AlkP superfamily phosphohydrolase/phosphomutase